MNAASTEEVVRVMELDGEEFLFYPCRPIDVALVRGTTADEEGNVTMEREAATLDTLSIAQATKNSGGIVIVQVERVTTRHLLAPREVRLPGILVDGVVVASGAAHMQTFAEGYNPAYAGDVRVVSEATGRDGAGRAQGDRPPRRDAAEDQLGREPRDRDTRGHRHGGQRGGDPRPDHAHRRGGRHRRRARRRPELRRGRQCAGDRRPALPVRLLRRRGTGPSLPRHGGGRPPRQRQRQPLRPTARRRRRLHQHQPGRPQLSASSARSPPAPKPPSATAGCAFDATARYRSSSTRSRRLPSTASAPVQPASPCSTSPSAACCGSATTASS